MKKPIVALIAGWVLGIALYYSHELAIGGLIIIFTTIYFLVGLMKAAGNFSLSESSIPSSKKTSLVITLIFVVLAIAGWISKDSKWSLCEMLAAGVCFCYFLWADNEQKKIDHVKENPTD